MTETEILYLFDGPLGCQAIECIVYEVRASQKEGFFLDILLPKGTEFKKGARIIRKKTDEDWEILHGYYDSHTGCVRVTAQKKKDSFKNS